MLNAMYQRMTERLLNYWRHLSVDGALPKESDINPDDLKDVWDSCFLINVKDNRFRYDYLGKQLVEAYGDDLSGHEISTTLLYPDSPTLFNAMQEALTLKQPVEDEGEFTNKYGVIVRYRSVVIPLVQAHEETPTYILGGMRWRGYASS